MDTSEPESEADYYLQPYLNEYYDSLTEENLEIGRFLHTVTAPRAQRPGTSSLDVGCGPTLLYWGLFVHSRDTHNGMDGLATNLAAIQAEIRRVRSGQVHERYHEICRWFGDEGCERMQALCDRIGRLEVVDFANDWPFATGSMDLVTMIFALECLPSRDALARALAEARRVLGEDGRLVIVSLCETTTWKIGDYTGSCLALTAESLHDALIGAGFRGVSVEKRAASTAVSRDQGYAWMLFATCDV